jgi:hypothetical protein
MQDLIHHAEQYYGSLTKLILQSANMVEETNTIAFTSSGLVSIFLVVAYQMQYVKVLLFYQRRGN